MNNPRTFQSSPLSRPLHTTKDEWEEWEDDEPVTPIDDGDGPLISPAPRSSPRSSTRMSARQSVQRLTRLKSRQRQKAQNAKAGITLVTDMSKLRAPHVALQMQPGQDARASRTGRFVDAAALNALEGTAPGDSGGSLAWLKKKQGQGQSQAQAQAQAPKNKRLMLLAAEAPTQADVSPIVGPIMIGFAMPSDTDVIISPQTAVVQTPVDFPSYFGKQPKAPSSKLPTSAWSPDTPDADDGTILHRLQSAGKTEPVPSIPRNYRDTRATSIMVSSDDDDDFPAPAPRGPRNNRDTTITDFYVSDGEVESPAVAPRQNNNNRDRDTKTTAIFVSDDEDDNSSPVTLFEEDGSPVATRQKSLKAMSRRRSTLISRARSKGWWDQVTSPFDHKSPTITQSPKATSPDYVGSKEWWKEIERKKTLSSAHNTDPGSASRRITATHRPPQIIIQDFSPVSPATPVYQASPKRAPLSPPEAVPSSAPAQAPPSGAQTQSEKPHALVEETQASSEVPPPYSPPSLQQKKNIRYRAVFPPGHPLNSMYPPSPGPVSPGLSRTMTSQGAISLTDVPLTPAPAGTTLRHEYVPDRSLGSSAPGNQFLGALGHGPRQESERKRRRHEKEDVAARKFSSCWKGCACLPAGGCFGKPGREGRKKRRCCCAICCLILLLIILGIVLGVVLSRHGPTNSTPYSPFLNLTNFPPMPTGISTVVGPDNTVANSACVAPSTVWSCSLPKEQASSVEPFDASQPTFIFQIQFDNDTGKQWKNEQPESPRPAQVRRESAGLIPFLRRLVNVRRDGSPAGGTIQPNPAPPSFADMFFLGNTSDGIVSDAKAGEPTPFFISVLRSLDDTTGPNLLTRRGVDNGTIDFSRLNDTFLPDLNPDGTSAPASLLAFPTQQPIRLYDRGLPTEHYGFYSYYNKTIYARNVAAKQPIDPLDGNGGALETEAKQLVTWFSTRYKVEFWTRAENTTQLLGGLNGAANNNSTRPGSFPYPMTVTLDTQGGILGQKFTLARGLDETQHIKKNDATLILRFLNASGTLINPASEHNPLFGGIDGGNGGCKCAYQNFVKLNGKSGAN